MWRSFLQLYKGTFFAFQTNTLKFYKMRKNIGLKILNFYKMYKLSLRSAWRTFLGTCEQFLVSLPCSQVKIKVRREDRRVLWSHLPKVSAAHKGKLLPSKHTEVLQNVKNKYTFTKRVKKRFGPVGALFWQRVNNFWCHCFVHQWKLRCAVRTEGLCDIYQRCLPPPPQRQLLAFNTYSTFTNCENEMLKIFGKRPKNVALLLAHFSGNVWTVVCFAALFTN